MRIRAANLDELEHLRSIERRAGAAFRDLGMNAVADDDPAPVELLTLYQAAGRAWVCVDEVAAGFAIGYAIADQIDGCGHLEQVSVDPAHSRQGIGRQLIDAVDRWSKQQGLLGLTLTTFVDVPWNGPYYERCGFRYLSDHEITPGLVEIRAAEARHGLDAWPRACMRRDLV